MAEILSPGVFIEEVPSALQVIQPVSTSNMAIVGFTKRGPTDTATLVTSFEQFTKIFGDLTQDSLVPLSVAAFYANGGRRCFVVRVAPSDAIDADAKIQSTTTDQQIETGDGVVVTFTKTAATSVLKDNAGASPLVASSVSIRWRAAALLVLGEVARNRTNTADLLGDAIKTKFEGRIHPTTSLTAFDEELDLVVPGTFVIHWMDPAPKLIIVASTATPVATATTPDGIVTIDLRTGRFSLEVTGPPPIVGPTFTLDFIPTTATKTIVDDGLGALTGVALAAPGTISYANGSYSFTTNAGDRPHAFAKVLAVYQINAWNLDPISTGAWGNDVRIDVRGDANFFDAATATYSRFTVNVLLRNSVGVFEIQETFEEIDFATPTSSVFFPDVLNELSDLVTVQEPGGNEAPLQLAGIDRRQVIATGDETAPAKTILATLANGPIATRSVSITWTDVPGATKTITDNGIGNLIGDVDAAGVNTINYTTGAINVTTSTVIKVTTLVTAVYRSAAAETTHQEVFGDTTKGYTVGTDGTFTPSTFGRSQLTDPSLLSPSFSGLYALSRVEEIMQVIIPDFAGDVTITGDLLDYADSRAGQPSGGDRFIILTVPQGSSAQEAVDWFRFSLNRTSNFAALYWPWVKVADPLSDNRPLTMPPLGHVAGIYARTDATKNVGKAPGGTVDGQLRFLIGLELEPTQGERDFVYPNKINPLISSPQTGLAVWGVRTIYSLSEWRYINARRLFMFLEKSVFNSTHWIVFENNGPGLWAKIKAQLGGFMTAQFNDGLFAGNTPAQAFFVIVDESNNTPESIEQGQVIIDVGVAPNKPAEFVRFRFTQKTLA